MSGDNLVEKHIRQNHPWQKLPANVKQVCSLFYLLHYIIIKKTMISQFLNSFFIYYFIKIWWYNITENFCFEIIYIKSEIAFIFSEHQLST